MRSETIIMRTSQVSIRGAMIGRRFKGRSGEVYRSLKKIAKKNGAIDITAMMGKGHPKFVFSFDGVTHKVPFSISPSASGAPKQAADELRRRMGWEK